MNDPKETQAIERFKFLLGRMSYHNAAERDWRNEISEQLACKELLQQAAKDLEALGIDPQSIVDQGSYLVDSEWKTKEEK